jgi:hypothetical protein
MANSFGPVQPIPRLGPINPFAATAFGLGPVFGQHSGGGGIFLGGGQELPPLPIGSLPGEKALAFRHLKCITQDSSFLSCSSVTALGH